MIAKALSRLEVGEIGIASFGQSFQFLHSFHDAFTDQSGAKVMSKFSFQQQTTNVPDLLSSLIKVLQVSKINVSHSETMQLVFIISDGRFGSKEIKHLTRQAEEQNMFLVFIVIDNPSNRDSILELQDVSFPNGKLTVSRYIDNFPFPYYIVLRDIKRLPEVCCDALRQWFERASKFEK